jgi:Tol biopolymer transport system component
MGKTAVVVAVTALAAAFSVARAEAPAAESPEVALKTATNLELVSGDLAGAIERYRGIVARYRTASPAVAARALLQMADCYQKLGNTESRKLYEQLVREFPGETEVVAIARARLGTTGSPARGDRAVWTGEAVDLFGTVSPDGRYLTYTDWLATGNLMLRDLEAGTSRALTGNTSYGELGEAGFSAISRDGERAVFGWTPRETSREELRVMSLDRPGLEASRLLRQCTEGESVRPFDWSPDGRLVVVLVEGKDRSSQIAIVDAGSGALRPLESIEWRATKQALFSPDGRYVAFDLASGEDPGSARILVKATDGSGEATVFSSAGRNRLMGWAQDGTLLFASDRSGSLSLWALPVAEGKAEAAPRLVKADIGSSWSLGLTRGGTLYVYRGENLSLQVGSIDWDKGTLSVPAGGFQRFIGAGGSPAWSPDGRLLAYRLCEADTEAPCRVAVASIGTGQVRELRPRLTWLGSVRWSSDGGSLEVDGTDPQGGRGIFRVEPQSGATSPILVPRPGAIPVLSADESKVYYREDASIRERDLRSGNERVVFAPRTAQSSVSILLSPDGRSIATVETTPTSATLFVLPVAGGAPRELMRVASPAEGLDGYRANWTPDGQALVVPRLRNGAAGPLELWRVPLDGGASRKLDIGATEGRLVGVGGFRLHPDGRQIAFVAYAGTVGPEVWALENFLPVTSARR